MYARSFRAEQRNREGGYLVKKFERLKIEGRQSPLATVVVSSFGTERANRCRLRCFSSALHRVICELSADLDFSLPVGAAMGVRDFWQLSPILDGHPRPGQVPEEKQWSPYLRNFAHGRLVYLMRTLLPRVGTKPGDRRYVLLRFPPKAHEQWDEQHVAKYGSKTRSFAQYFFFFELLG